MCHTRETMEDFASLDCFPRAQIDFSVDRAVNEAAGHAKSAKSKVSFADLLCVVLLISLCLSIGLPRWRSGMDWSDEGFLAYGAVRVMEGQVPNRDFVSLQPPLSFYTAAAMFELFGTSLASLRILGLLIYISIPLLVYGIARNLAKPALSLAAGIPAAVLGIPYFYFVPFAVWQGITATLAAIFLYMQATLGGRRFLALPAGVLTAVSILLRHDQGLYLVISIFTLTWALKHAQGEPVPGATLKRVFVLWLAGASTMILCFGIYWAAEGALAEMFKQLIIFPITTYAKTSALPFHYFSSRLPFSRNGVIALYYLPPIIIIITGIWLVRRRLHRSFCSREAVFTFLVVWSGLFYLQVLTRSDIFHLLMTLSPFFILLACCSGVFLKNLDGILGKWAQNRPVSKVPKILVSVLAGVGATYFLWAISAVCLPEMTRFKETLMLERGGVRVENAEATADVVRAVQKYAPPDRSILCLPYQPMFYFLCERRNPTRWNYLWPGDQTASDYEALILQAKNDPPAVVLIMKEQAMSSYAPAILDYVHAEYRRAGDSADLGVYLPQRIP